MNNERQLQLVTFGQAKALKALGFNWHCGAYYGADNGIFARSETIKKSKRMVFAPTVALALKWARDAKGIIGDLRHGNMFGKWCYMLHPDPNYLWCYMLHPDPNYLGNFDAYDEAESALLDAVIAKLGKGERA